MERDINDRKKIAIVFLVSFVLHSIMIFFVKLPTSGPDELATMSSAAYLAGYDWSDMVSRHGAYYGFGSAWFMAPIFMLVKDPVIIYTLARLFLSFILSLTGPIAYIILKKYVNIKNELLVVNGAIACSFFNNTTGDAFVNEPMLILICWCIILLLLKINVTNSTKQKRVYSFLLGILMCYSLTVHTRAMLYYAALIFIVIVFKFIYKKWIVNIPFFLGASVLIVPTNLLIDFVKGILFNAESATSLNNSAEYYMTEMSSNIGLMFQMYGLKLSVIGIVILFVTNLVAIVVYTLGLIIPATTLTFRNLWIDFKEKKEEKYLLNIVSTFAIVGLYGTLLSFSVMHMYHGVTLHTGTLPGDGRFFFYLRYFNNFLPPILIVIIKFFDKSYIEERRFAINSSIILMCLGCVAFSILFIRKIDMVNIEAFDIGNVFSSILFRTHAQQFTVAHYYLAILAIVCLGLCIYYLLKHKKKIIVAIVLIGLLFFQQIFTVIETRKLSADHLYSCVDATHELIINNDEVYSGFDTIYTYSEEAYRMQYMYQMLFYDKTVIPFKSEGNEYMKLPFDTSKAVPIVNNTEYVLVSNNLLSIEGAYIAMLDENEYLYTNSKKYVELFELNEKITFEMLKVTENN